MILLCQVFHAPQFRVYTSDDPIGVEVAGALKNVIAIASGKRPARKCLQTLNTNTLIHGRTQAQHTKKAHMHTYIHAHLHTCTHAHMHTQATIRYKNIIASGKRLAHHSSNLTPKSMEHRQTHKRAHLCRCYFAMDKSHTHILTHKYICTHTHILIKKSNTYPPFLFLFPI